jgi:hypothetical protein
MKRAAIVTLVVGEKYLEAWKKYCAAGLQAYAQKHNYDLIVVTKPLDEAERAKGRSAAWQKCLVLSQEFAQPYEQIILLDGDIVINAEAAPSVIEQVPVDRVGGVISGSHIHEDLRAVLLSRMRGPDRPYQRGPQAWIEDQRRYYREHKLSELDEIVQTGVLVASPRHHRQLFEKVYHEEYADTRAYEQIPLSHALLTSGVFQRVDTRFNSVFFETMRVYYPYLSNKSTPNFKLLAHLATRVEYENNFFIHFSYGMKFIEYLFETPA